MNGPRIAAVRESLRLCLHSLPLDGFLNIVCLSWSSEVQPLWDQSSPVTPVTICDALEFVNAITADFPGTESPHDDSTGGLELADALEWIADSPEICPGRKRQLFIISDGEDGNQDRAIALICETLERMRCFTIGIGSGADPRVLPALASLTQGMFAFVGDGVDLRSKLIPLLAAARANTFDEVSVQIDGAFLKEELHMQPLATERLSTHFAVCSMVKPSAQVVVSGVIDDEPVDYSSAIAFACDDPVVVDGVRRYADWLTAIAVQRQAFKLRLVLPEEVRQSIIPRAVELSLQCGIPAADTVLVPVVKAVRGNRGVFVWRGLEGAVSWFEKPPFANRLSDAIAAEYGVSVDSICVDSDSQIAVLPNDREVAFILKTATVGNAPLIFDAGDRIRDIKATVQFCVPCEVREPRLIGAGTELEDDDFVSAIPQGAFVELVSGEGDESSEVVVAEIEAVRNRVDTSELLENHSVEGFWTNAETLLEWVRLGTRPELPEVHEDVRESVFATVLAVALLRRACGGEQLSWQLLEAKALAWLATVAGIVPWSGVIDDVAKLLPEIDD
jgi:hypothetical protein